MMAKEHGSRAGGATNEWATLRTPRHLPLAWVFGEPVVFVVLAIAARGGGGPGGGSARYEGPMGKSDAHLLARGLARGGPSRAGRNPRRAPATTPLDRAGPPCGR